MSYSNIKKTQDIEKRDYLVGKMAQGAEALKEFFETTIQKPAIEPQSTAKKLASKYELTKNQTKYLRKIANNVAKVNYIINHLTNKFKLDNDRCIENKEELYRLVYEEEPPKNFWIKPLSFAIGFYLPDDCFEKTKKKSVIFGQTDTDEIDSVIKQNIKYLRKGKDVYFGLNALSFMINYSKDKQKNPEDPLSAELFNPNLTKYKTEQHELKHIIDKFLLSTNPILSEFSASLFEEDSEQVLKQSLLKDCYELNQSLDDAIETRANENLLAILSEEPQQVENPDSSVEEKQRDLESLKKTLRENPDMKNMIENLGKRTFSYIITTTDHFKLNRRLKLLGDHFNV